jgi:hypothetical protein
MVLRVGNDFWRAIDPSTYHGHQRQFRIAGVLGAFSLEIWNVKGEEI